MSSTTTITAPGTIPEASNTYPRPPAPGAPDLASKPTAHTHAAQPAQVHVPLVKETMGALAMEAVQAIQLLAGIPIPANLGPNLDTTA